MLAQREQGKETTCVAIDDDKAFAAGSLSDALGNDYVMRNWQTVWLEVVGRRPRVASGVASGGGRARGGAGGGGGLPDTVLVVGVVVAVLGVGVGGRDAEAASAEAHGAAAARDTRVDHGYEEEGEPLHARRRALRVTEGGGVGGAAAADDDDAAAVEDEDGVAAEDDDGATTATRPPSPPSIESEAAAAKPKPVPSDVAADLKSMQTQMLIPAVKKILDDTWTTKG